jgi:hypothetical protein
VIGCCCEISERERERERERGVEGERDWRGQFVNICNKK